jgi:hypothetical protein
MYNVPLDELTSDIDIRTIPVDKLPTPPDGWKWFMESNSISLATSEFDYIEYNVPEGDIHGQAEKSIFAFFINAIRKVCFEEYVRNGCVNERLENMKLAVNILDKLAESEQDEDKRLVYSLFVDALHYTWLVRPKHFRALDYITDYVFGNEKPDYDTLRQLLIDNKWELNAPESNV